jgi:hypothetical protein
MSISEQLLQIWADEGLDPSPYVSEEDYAAAETSVNGESRLFYYGNFCGPGTKSDLDTVPQDALDLCCKLHDRFYSLHTARTADLCLRKSAKFLMENEMVGESALPYVDAMDSGWFSMASFVWSERFVAIPVMVGFLVLLSVVIALTTATISGHIRAKRLKK